jgi:hypothetical protein
MGRPLSKHSVVDFALLSGFGALCVHEIAYAPASLSRAAVSHAHLPLLWAVASPLAVLALGMYVIRSLKSRPGANSVAPKQLAAVIAVAFGALEIGERAINGLSVQGLAAEQVFWLGFAAIPFVTYALARLVSNAVDVISRWVALPHPGEFVQVRILSTGSVSGVAFHSQSLRHTQSRRGPPNRIVR